MYYFAYGSNMGRNAMRRRCPAAHAIGPAALEGFRFFVGIDGWGSVMPSAGDTVHGVLWRLTPRDIAALHAYELLHQGLYQLRHLPVRRGSRRLSAMVYLLRRRAPGRSRPGYVEMIAAAARDWKLPEDYIRSVERWSTSRWTTARRRRRRARMSSIRHVSIRGRVQGVGYRAFVEVEALRRRLQGWVRNRTDGTVEAVFMGENAAVADMIETCRGGPMGARVEALYQQDGDADALKLRRTGELFSVLPTV
jgi:acylphosphatase